MMASWRVRGDSMCEKNFSMQIHCGLPYPVKSSSLSSMSRLAQMPAEGCPGAHLMEQLIASSWKCSLTYPPQLVTPDSGVQLSMYLWSGSRGSGKRYIEGWEMHSCGERRGPLQEQMQSPLRAKRCLNLLILAQELRLGAMPNRPRPASLSRVVSVEGATPTPS